MVLCLGLAIVLTTSAVTITFYFAKMSLGEFRLEEEILSQPWKT
jgi:hypothetical protein